MRRVTTWAVGAGLAVVLLLAAAGAGVVSAVWGGGAACQAAVTDPHAAPHGLTPERAANAAVIVAAGQRTRVPVRGWVIAVATALQESNLINRGIATDHDSLGLFQQRPSQGWGTAEQIMNPDYAAAKFYEHLVRVPGWQSLPLTVAAQAVQRSALPDAYAKHEARASAIVAAFTGGVVCDGGAGLPPGDVPELPPGFTLPPDTPGPVVVAVRWALGQLGTPYAFGGDCTAAHSGNPAHQCDCSSLVQQAYRAAGYTLLPRLARHQARVGAPVGLSDLRPGDLIFIVGADGTRERPGHVGMAIGSGLVVHAPQTGDVVKISRVSRWANELVTIRRIVPT
jgi:cell wall-associated NlpC family hydrolase